MTKAEFDFNLNISLQLFKSKFSCNPGMIYVDSKTYNNIIKKNTYTNHYRCNSYNYRISVYIQINIQDYLSLYNNVNQNIIFIGRHSETRY